ncbi:hypothetical protein HDU76_012101 [Blyttiomyces sp. JEL0837]|nr:hypothetical protein HDU76_012101 [Blyttiomyces sp. JEL0837]
MAGLADGRRSNNGRALTRKAISYQKRQLFTNICCIALCPFFMVLICAGLGTAIQNLINSSTNRDLHFCSNVDDLNNDGFPIFNYTDPKSEANGYNLNYIQVLDLSAINGNPGAATLSGNHPCKDSNANLPAAGKIDSTYIPPPNGGWVQTLQRQFSSLTPDDLELRQFTNFELGSWVLSAASSDANAATLGARPKTTPYNYSEITETLANTLVYRNLTTKSDSTGGFGLLGAISQRLYVNLTVANTTTAANTTTRVPYSFQGLNAVPYYVPQSTNKDEDLDDALTAKIQELLTALASLDKSVLQKTGATNAEITKFYLQASQVTNLMPYGAVYLDDIDLNKLFMMMKMNGLKAWAYYLSHYVTFYILFAISSIIFLIAGRASKLTFFTLTQTSVLILLFFIWGHPYTFAMLKGSEVGTAVNFLVIEIFIYGLLALYLGAVVPSEFGTRRPWHFPVTDTIKYFQKQQRKKANGGIDIHSEAHIANNLVIDSTETQFEDDDVRAEINRIDSGNYPSNSPVILSHMRKIYGGRGGLGPKIAVKDVTLACEPGLVLGLLGPNGAGKTTLISILTGLYEASAGEAMLAGYNIKTDLSEVYKVIGCWFSDERKAVDESLAKVSLQSFRTRLTKRLSGGEKRRLSIAIALVGDPAVVFLDEPTTGLDPEVRRLIWNIIQNAREGKTIILTTHSMEEAEALCQRIGIMAKGTLKCLANPLRLKELYGSGFKLFFNSHEIDTPRASRYIESLLPQGWRKVDAFATNTSYEFPSKPGVISYLFEAVEKSKNEHGILDWGISQTTLEEVFLKIISANDADAD